MSVSYTHTHTHNTLIHQAWEKHFRRCWSKFYLPGRFHTSSCFMESSEHLLNLLRHFLICSWEALSGKNNSYNMSREMFVVPISNHWSDLQTLEIFACQCFKWNILSKVCPSLPIGAGVCVMFDSFSLVYCNRTLNRWIENKTACVRRINYVIKTWAFFNSHIFICGLF